MLEMRPGRPEEVPAQKALWKAAFGDEGRYIDWFYECCGASADVLEVVEEGRLASMLALLPQTLTLPGGGTASGWYIYALATDPGARSKGYGRQLLRFVDGYLAERGADCVTTVPAEPSLFKFFGTVGFAPCFSTRKLELLKSMLQPAAEGDRAEPVEPGEYNAIRRRLLEGAPAVDYPEELIRYQQGMGRLSGGGLYRLSVDGAEGCAAGRAFAGAQWVKGLRCCVYRRARLGSQHHAYAQAAHTPPVGVCCCVVPCDGQLVCAQVAFWYGVCRSSGRSIGHHVVDAIQHLETLDALHEWLGFKAATARLARAHQRWFAVR